LATSPSALRALSERRHLSSLSPRVQVAPLGGKVPDECQVAIQNGGATLTSGISATVTLAIGINPSGGVLACTGDTTVGSIAGVATFTGCSIDKAGTGYTLTATASNAGGNDIARRRSTASCARLAT